MLRQPAAGQPVSPETVVFLRSDAPLTSLHDSPVPSVPGYGHPVSGRSRKGDPGVRRRGVDR